MLVLIVVSVMLFFLDSGHNRIFSWVRMVLYILFAFLYSGYGTSGPLPEIIVENKSVITSLIFPAFLVIAVLLVVIYVIKRKRA